MTPHIMMIYRWIMCEDNMAVKRLSNIKVLNNKEPADIEIDNIILFLREYIMINKSRCKHFNKDGVSYKWMEIYKKNSGKYPDLQCSRCGKIIPGNKTGLYDPNE